MAEVDNYLHSIGSSGDTDFIKEDLLTISAGSGSSGEVPNGKPGESGQSVLCKTCLIVMFAYVSFLYNLSL